MSIEQKQTSLVGWSSQSSAPEILEVAKKKTKNQSGVTLGLYWWCFLWDSY